MPSFLYRNVANITSILGVLPLALLFTDQGYLFLIPFIVYNNVMDDLDGILAAKLNIRSKFGANLDNLCDAFAHGGVVLFVGMHFGGWVCAAALMAATSAIIRSTARLDPSSTILGAPTNELMRHLLVILVLSEWLVFDPSVALIVVFFCHSYSMISARPMPTMIRARANTATKVMGVNVLLVLIWLYPPSALVLGAVFFGTYGLDLAKSLLGGVNSKPLSQID